MSLVSKATPSTPAEWAVVILAPHGAPMRMWGVVGELGKLADDRGRLLLTDSAIASARAFLDMEQADFMGVVHELVSARWLAPLRVDVSGFVTHLSRPR